MKNLAIGLFVVALMSSCSDELSQARPYVLTTATTGGTFYPVGVAIATITHAQLATSQGISLTAISSAGSLENDDGAVQSSCLSLLLEDMFASCRKQICNFDQKTEETSTLARL